MNRLNVISTALMMVLAAGIGYNYGTLKGLKLASDPTIVTAPSANNSDFEEFILENPTVLIDSLEQHQLKMAEEAEKDVQSQVEKNYDKIYTKNSFVVGNPDAEVKIVEFFDYKCGYCKKTAKVLQELVEKNPNVQVYYKDMPILGQASMEAAKAAVAAGLLGKYKEYNKALLETTKPLNEDTFREVAKKVDLKENELIEMMSSQKVANILMENRMAANIVQLQGTPTILIETEIYKGAHTLESLQESIRVQMEAKMK